MRDPVRSLGGILRAHVYPVLRRSYLYNLLRAVRQGIDRRNAVMFRFADGSQIQLFPGELASKAAQGQPGRREFQLVMDALRRLHAIATENGTKMLVVLQPAKEEVYLPLLGQEPPDPTSALRLALGRAGMGYLDLTPGFQERAAGGERLFFETDAHPSAAGDALIAELVAAHLRLYGNKYGLTE
jgi:hypothetical protein